MLLNPPGAPFERALFTPVSPPGLFNPYRDEAPAYDVPGAACTYVRHPSQGGARLFEAGVRAALRELGLADAS